MSFPYKETKLDQSTHISQATMPSKNPRGLNRKTEIDSAQPDGDGEYAWQASYCHVMVSHSSPNGGHDRAFNDRTKKDGE